MGTTKAAFVVNELVKPASVIVSYANQTSTEGGKLLAGTKADKFIKATKVPVDIPLSSNAMEFNGSGKSVNSCYLSLGL